ncbi:spherulation-specific family 4 protein [Streptomyces sp. CA-250714]|uniref:spherulation-specific family 4 protein n=1 Tax=Streptomyces sp. CA-250714 TaxID=3240060 RepID=UPI003D8AAC67
MPRPARLLTLVAAVAAAGAFTAVALPALATPDQPASDAAPGQKVSVPAYFAPGPSWDRLVKGGKAVGMAVANPASGPGTGPDEEYLASLRKADSAGVDIIGYVPTGYFGTTGLKTRGGATDPAAWMRQIKADIDRWYEMYGSAGLDGIFFDEGLSKCGPDNSYVDYYAELKKYVEDNHGTEAVVVDNPGTGAEECYTRAADTLVTFEGSENSYRQHRPEAWEAKASSERIWHLVYDVPDTARMKEVVALSAERNADHVYVTNDTTTDQNPWDTLPPAAYWESELGQTGRFS